MARRYKIYDVKGRFWKSLKLTPSDVRHFRRRLKLKVIPSKKKRGR